MTRERFHEIFHNMVFSVWPKERSDNMSCENYRWMLVEDFIADFPPVLL
jgi:hypothetical protein